MLLLTLAVALSAAPIEPVQLASIGMSGPASRQELVESLASTLALRMTETGLVRVTTPADIVAVLGLERQRQLLGCSETSCVAELAGALGAKGIVSGELAVVGGVLQLTVKVMDAVSAKPLFQALERHRDEASLLGAIDRIAFAAAEQVSQHFGGASARSAPLGRVVLLASGVGLAVGGTVLLALAKVDEVALREGQVSTAALAVDRRDAGSLKQALGIGLVAGGVVGSAAALVWALVDAPSSSPVTIAPTHQGVVIGGHF